MTFSKQDFEEPEHEFQKRARKQADTWAAKYGYALAAKDAKHSSIVRIVSLVSLILAFSSLILYIIGIV